MEKRIREEPDYIRCPKCMNSLKKLMARNGEGLKNDTIARVLMISEEEVESIYEDAIKMLKKAVLDDEG